MAGYARSSLEEKERVLKRKKKEGSMSVEVLIPMGVKVILKLVLPAIFDWQIVIINIFFQFVEPTKRKGKRELGKRGEKGRRRDEEEEEGTWRSGSCPE